MALDFGDVEEVKEVISQNSRSKTLWIDEDTFIPNVFGYGCPVPAINVKHLTSRDHALNHMELGADFNEKGLALEIRDPKMRFCTHIWDTEIFGEDFVVGGKIEIELSTKREIIQVTKVDGTVRKVLRETITSELNGYGLISVAELDLGLVK